MLVRKEGGRSRSLSLFFELVSVYNPCTHGWDVCIWALAKGHQKGSHGRTRLAHRGKATAQWDWISCKLNTRALEHCETDGKTITSVTDKFEEKGDRSKSIKVCTVSRRSRLLMAAVLFPTT